MEKAAASLAHVLRKAVGKKNKRVRVQNSQDTEEAANHRHTLLSSKSILNANYPCPIVQTISFVVPSGPFQFRGI